MELNFEQANGFWLCKLTGYTPGQVVQLKLAERAPVMVLAAIQGMDPMHLSTVQNLTGDGVMLELALPEGLEVTIRTRSEVVKAKIV